MSGIVGSRLNTRGSGLVGSLGSDGQVLTSAGAGKGIVFEAAGGGQSTLISTVTASDAATASFTDIDDSYRNYVVTFNDLVPVTDNVTFLFLASHDNGSNYDGSITNAFHHTGNYDDDTGFESEGNPAYSRGNDTDGVEFAFGIGSASLECCNGFMYLYNPGKLYSSVVLTHFYCHFNNTNYYSHGAYATDVNGHIDSASAVDAIQFKFSSGNIESGTFKLWGQA